MRLPELNRRKSEILRIRCQKSIFMQRYCSTERSRENELYQIQNENSFSSSRERVCSPDVEFMFAKPIVGGWGCSRMNGRRFWSQYAAFSWAWQERKANRWIDETTKWMYQRPTERVKRDNLKLGILFITMIVFFMPLFYNLFERFMFFHRSISYMALNCVNRAHKFYLIISSSGTHTHTARPYCVPKPKC